MAEVAVRRTARDDQEVVLDAAGRRLDRVRRRVERAHLVPEHGDVLLRPQDLPQRRRDVGRGECGGRDLVEERLEQVMVAAVDQDHVDVSPREGAHRPQPAEAAADDDHTGSLACVRRR